MTPDPPATLGVIGGSGLYSFVADAETVEVTTAHGAPSAPLTLAHVAGRRVAFLPRHGPRHTVPPHRINYRANLRALRDAGVERVLAPCAVGSLRVEHAPGTVVVCDQLVNFTSGRADTYFDGPEVAHLSAPDPYCPELRPLALRCVRDAGLAAHDGGTVVVVNGPRFSTRAESRMFASFGWDVINMTQYPEAVLARELGMCYLALALVTDYDNGLPGVAGTSAVTQEEVFATFARSTDALRDAIVRIVTAVPEARGCDCGRAPQPL